MQQLLGAPAHLWVPITSLRACLHHVHALARMPAAQRLGGSAAAGEKRSTSRLPQVTTCAAAGRCSRGLRDSPWTYKILYNPEWVLKAVIWAGRHDEMCGHLRRTPGGEQGTSSTESSRASIPRIGSRCRRWAGGSGDTDPHGRSTPGDLCREVRGGDLRPSRLREEDPKDEASGYGCRDETTARRPAGPGAQEGQPC